MKFLSQKVLILLIAFAAIVWAAWQKFEWTDERQWIDADAEVVKRPMMAAGLFLESQGFAVHRVLDQRSFDDIPDTVGTLFMCEGKLSLSEQHFSELRRWVINGGHLVINSAGGGELLEDEDDVSSKTDDLRSMPVANLYQEQGIRLGNDAASQDCWQQAINFEPAGSGDALEQVVEAVADSLSAADDQLAAVRYTGPLPGADSRRDMTVEFEGANWLLHEPPYSADWHWISDRGTQLLSAPYGDGQLTVMADFWPIFNAAIGQHDNAYALQQIVSAGSGQTKTVWFHERELAYPSLASVLWHRTPWVLVSALLALVFLFWMLFARRFEPSAGELSRHSQLRRQMHAVASYRWRVGDMAQLSQLLSSSTNKGPKSERKNSEALNEAPLRRSKAELILQAQAHWQAANTSRGENKHG